MKQVIENNGWGLKVKDFLKGLFMAVGTPVLYVLQELIPDWPLSPIEKAALSATVAYLLKNFFTDDVKAAKETLTKEADKKRVNYFISPSDK